MGLVAIAGLLGTATATYFIVRHNTSEADLAYQTAVVQSQDITVQIKANGTIQPLRKINLSPREQGRVERLYVDEGDRVRQGQLIARMDNGQVRSQVKQNTAALVKARAALIQKQRGNNPEDIIKAKAQVAKSEAQVIDARSRLASATNLIQRKQMLVQSGAISREELERDLTEQRNAKNSLRQAQADLIVARQELILQRRGSRVEEITQAQADVTQAVAQLQNSQIQLENTIVRAPFAGTVTRKFAQKGDLVTPSTAASSSDGATSSSIAELSSGLEVEAKMPEASIARIQVGQQVEIRSDAYPERIFQGRVRLVAPRAAQDNQGNQTSGGAGGGVTSFRVKVVLKTGQDMLKSGMNVRLNFISNRIRHALVVPLAAVVTQKEGKTGVWILG